MSSCNQDDSQPETHIRPDTLRHPIKQDPDEEECYAEALPVEQDSEPESEGSRHDQHGDYANSSRQVDNNDFSENESDENSTEKNSNDDGIHANADNGNSSDDNGDDEVEVEAEVYDDEDQEDADEDSRHRDSERPHQLERERQRQQQVPLSQSSHVEDCTRVNGIGIWNSWKKNFKSPLFAFLDLFDNAIDACFDFKDSKDGRVGEISVSLEDAAAKMSNGTGDGESNRKSCNELLLRNNSSRRISPIQDILELYKSHKDTSTIGQNGIGTKQACANLCDLSFIITKNKNEISMGVIAKSLQTSAGPYLPSMTFVNEDDSNNIDVYQQLHNVDWGRVFAEYGGNIQSSMREGHDNPKQLGLDRVYQHIQNIIKDTRNDYVFLCVLTQIRHDNCNNLLAEIHEALPLYYVHVPNSFNVTIGDREVDFQYWEKRLVELSVFHLKIHSKQLWYTNNDWKDQLSLDENDEVKNDSENTYDSMRVFIGFDAYANNGEDSKSKEAALYIYSRRSGRLVKQVKNARGYLKLTTGSSDYCQGLTVLVDDYTGSLPLTPTKQDLAFSLENNGETHEINFETWISAVVHMYYNYHLYKLGDRKDALGNAVSDAKHDLEKQVKLLMRSGTNNISPLSSLSSLNDGKFTSVKGVTWRSYKDERIRVFNKKDVIRCKEKDTLVHLKHINKEVLQQQKQQKEADKKRKYQEEYFKLLSQSQCSQESRSALSQSMPQPVSQSRAAGRMRRRLPTAAAFAVQNSNSHSDEDADCNNDLGDDTNKDNATRRNSLLSSQNDSAFHRKRKKIKSEGGTFDEEAYVIKAEKAEIVSIKKQRNQTPEEKEQKLKHKKLKRNFKLLIEENKKLWSINKSQEKKIMKLQRKQKAGRLAAAAGKVQATTLSATETDESDQENKKLKSKEMRQKDEKIKKLEEALEKVESKLEEMENVVKKSQNEKDEIESSRNDLVREVELMNQLESESQEEIKLLRRKIDTLKSLSNL